MCIDTHTVPKCFGTQEPHQYTYNVHYRTTFVVLLGPIGSSSALNWFCTYILVLCISALCRSALGLFWAHRAHSFQSTSPPSLLRYRAKYSAVRKQFLVYSALCGVLK